MMMKTIAMAALFGAALTMPAEAEQVTMSRPIAAGSLHEGPLDMVAYWIDGQDGALELTATFRARTPSDEPMRVVMPLQDGDRLAFGMPGHPGALYRFGRSGREVTISVEVKPKLLAEN